MSDSTTSIDGLISWVYTGDLDATSVFYQETLGFTCERDEGRARIFRVAPNACIGVCEAFDGRVVQADGGMISIVTADVDAWYHRLQAYGLELEPPQRLETFGIYCMQLRDPNGYAIEFQQFDE